MSQERFNRLPLLSIEKDKLKHVDYSSSIDDNSCKELMLEELIICESFIFGKGCSECDL